MLVFETEPLAEDLRVVGIDHGEVHVSTDAPDVDLWLKLFDVAAGRHGLEPDEPGPRRAARELSRRRSGAQAAASRAASTRCVSRTCSPGNLFAKGHRLRSSLPASFFPRFSRNLQTGELETESASVRKAEVRIHHDRERPSSLTLTVVP